MIFSPIFRYELLTVGRRRRYFLMRVLYALTLLIALAGSFVDLQFLIQTRTPPVELYARLAFSYFTTFAFIQLTCIMLLTPALVAGTIASEHERRTIDYLLTTQLTDFEITLGKFTARLLTIGSLLVTAVPIVGLMMMLGGISPKMVLETFWYALLVLVATASLSLWISAASRQSRTAVTSSYLAVLVVVGLVPLAYGILFEELGYPQRGTLHSCFKAAMSWNPYVVQYFVMYPGTGNISTMASPLNAGIVCGIFSTVCLLCATLSVRRTYLRSAGRSAGSGPENALVRWLRSGRLILPRLKFENFPMLRKELISQQGAFKVGLGGRVASALLFLTACIGLALILHDGTGGLTPVSQHDYYPQYQNTRLHRFGVITEMVVGTLALLLITARAAGSATAEKEQDCWLTLLSTPLSGTEIVLAKTIAALNSVRYWYLFLVALWVCCAVHYPDYLYILPILIGAHFTLGWFCATVGVLYSIACKNSLRSIGAALLTVGVVGGGLPFLASGVIGWIDMDSDYRRSITLCAFPAILGAWDALLVYQFEGVPDYFLLAHARQIAVLTTATATYAALAPMLSYFACVNFDRFTGRIVKLVGAQSPPSAPPAAVEARA